MKVSAVSFVYNEEKDIRACLNSLVEFVDEILIVDMSSTDKTAEIAYEFTKRIFRKPHLICGDQYKEFLNHNAVGDWLLWFYPDERFGDCFVGALQKLTDSDKFDTYALMRHEYMDDVRLPGHGTNKSPNFQNRLHRKGQGIFYTDLVHAEVHGRFRSCNLPEEYFMEHRKTTSEQEFDNWRTYVEMKHLLWKYRDTKAEPYKTYCDSYRQIIAESEKLNEEGKRLPHLAEEFWWQWWLHKDKQRVKPEELAHA